MSFLRKIYDLRMSCEAPCKEQRKDPVCSTTDQTRGQEEMRHTSYLLRKSSVPPCFYTSLTFLKHEASLGQEDISASVTPEESFMEEGNNRLGAERTQT